MFFSDDDDEVDRINEEAKQKLLIAEQGITFPCESIIHEEEKLLESWMYQMEFDYEEQEPHDLGDLFGFDEANKIIENLIQKNLGEPDFMPYMFFVNNGDTFHGMVIIENIGSEPYVKHVETFVEIKEDNEDEEDEEEELEEEQEISETNKKERKPPPTYQIITTLRYPKLYTQSEYISEIIQNSSTKHHLFERILKCGTIVYDISQFYDKIEEATWVIQELEKYLDRLKETVPRAFKKYSKIRRFILITNILTWAKTNPIDPTDLECPLTEADFRKRKPNEKYKDHVILEKEVLRIGKKYPNILRTAVVCAGLTYGLQNCTLNYLFKLGWKNENYLPIIGNGENLIPMIHIIDLARLIFEIGTTLEESPSYLLAIERKPLKQSKIVEAISKGLSTGMVKYIKEEEAFLINEVTQNVFDMLTINLNMRPTHITETDHKWHVESNFVANIENLVKEYKSAWKLKAMKFFIHGPPIVGKTTLAKKIASHYQIPYISKDQIVVDTIKELKEEIEMKKLRKSLQEEENLKNKINENEEDDEEDIDENEEEEDDDDNNFNNKFSDDDNLETLESNLNEIEKELYEHKGIAPKNLIKRLIKDRLFSKSCLKHGYVLDGFPEILSEAQYLFDLLDNEEEENEAEVPNTKEEEDQKEEQEEEVENIKKKDYNALIMPEFVISLEAKRRDLCQRLIDMDHISLEDSKKAVRQFYNDFIKHLKLNSNEVTVLNYFDEREVYPMYFKGTLQEDILLNKVKNRVGKPCLLKQTIEEMEGIREKLKQKDFEKQKQAEENIRMQKLKEEEKNEEKMEKWLKLMERLKHEEEEVLALQGLPLRHYLMRYIFPTLTRGLIEVSKIKPDDPIDFLAEFLFRENPEGKMFQPDFITCPNDVEVALNEFHDSLQTVRLGDFEYPEGEDTNFPYIEASPENSDTDISESEINIQEDKSKNESEVD